MKIMKSKKNKLRLSRMLGVWIQNIAGLLVITTCSLIIFRQLNPLPQPTLSPATQAEASVINPAFDTIPQNETQMPHVVISEIEPEEITPNQSFVPNWTLIGESPPAKISAQNKRDLALLSASRIVDTQTSSIPQSLVSEKVDKELMLERIQRYIRVQNGNLDEGTINTLAKSILQYGEEMELPIELVMAVAQTESTFNPYAKGTPVQVKGHGTVSALGPMQVIWEYHSALLQSIGIKKADELLHPVSGIKAGSVLLKRYMDAQGSITGGLGKYYGALSPQYISKVLANYLTAGMALSGHLEEEGIKRSNKIEATNLGLLTSSVKASSSPSTPRPARKGSGALQRTSSSSSPASSTGATIWAGSNITVIPSK